MYPSVVVALFWIVAWSGTENNFNLHGWWPQQTYCGGDRFNLSQLEPVLPYMKQFWFIPSVNEVTPESNPQNFTNSYSFWEHEWRKHGTCSGLQQLTYFQTALEHYFRLNPMSCLMKQDIYPSNQLLWSPDLIQAALTECFGQSVQLVCQDNLWEEIYYNSTGKTNCPLSILWLAGDRKIEARRTTSSVKVFDRDGGRRRLEIVRSKLD